MIINDIAAAQHALEIAKREGADTALSYLMSVMINLYMDKSIIGKALFVPHIDSAVKEIGRGIDSNFSKIPNGTSNNIVIHIATEVYSTGGHTRIIEDIAGIFPRHQHILVLTDLYGNCQAGRANVSGLNDRFLKKNIKVIFLGDGSITERVKRLREIVSNFKPKVVSLMAHHFDVVTYSAVNDSLAASVLFFHHADHQASLGATRTDYAHIDFGPACYHACSSNQFLNHTMIGMTVPDAKPLKKVRSNEPLIGATSGNWHKFVGFNSFTYIDLLIALFKNGVGKFYHIGGVPDDQISIIRSTIQGIGGNSDWITFTGEVQSLQNTMREIEPDFYMNSHPTGGGRATVEAMSLGLPIIDPAPPSINRLTHDDMTLGMSMRVMNINDIGSILARINEDIEYISFGTRSIYEKNYTIESCIDKIGRYFI